MKNLKYFLIVLCSIFLCSLIATNSYAKAEKKIKSIDHIVAIVNDDVVTKTELDHATALMKMQMVQAQADPVRVKQMEKQMLDQMINKKLQLQIAKQIEVTVSDEDIDKAIQDIAKQNNLSTTELYQHVQQEGLSRDDYRGELHDQLILQKLQQQEILPHINITPDEVTQFTRNKAWKNDIVNDPNAEKEYQVEDILVPVADNAPLEAVGKAKKEASLMFERLQHAGTRAFAENGAPQLNADEQAKGVVATDLGFRRLTQIPSAFATHLITLSPKELAGPIQTGNGFHIIRLTAERALGTKNEVEPSKEQIQQLVFQHKVAEAIKTWLSKVRSQAFIITGPEAEKG